MDKDGLTKRPTKEEAVGAPDPEPTPGVELQLSSGARRCPFCHADVPTDADWVACRGCLAPHHAACWIEGGRKCASCGAATNLARRNRPSKRVVALLALLVALPASYAVRSRLTAPAPLVVATPPVSLGNVWASVPIGTSYELESTSSHAGSEPGVPPRVVVTKRTLTGLRASGPELLQEQSGPGLAHSFTTTEPLDTFAAYTAGAKRSPRTEEIKVPAGVFQCDVYVRETHDGDRTRVHTTWIAKGVPVPIRSVGSSSTGTTSIVLTRITPPASTTTSERPSPPPAPSTPPEDPYVCPWGNVPIGTSAETETRIDSLNEDGSSNGRLSTTTEKDRLAGLSATEVTFEQEFSSTGPDRQVHTTVLPLHIHYNPYARCQHLPQRERIEVPAGTFDCDVYVSKKGGPLADPFDTTQWFAKGVPLPVKVEQTMVGQRTVKVLTRLTRSGSAAEETASVAAAPSGPTHPNPWASVPVGTVCESQTTTETLAEDGKLKDRQQYTSRNTLVGLSAAEVSVKNATFDDKHWTTTRSPCELPGAVCEGLTHLPGRERIEVPAGVFDCDVYDIKVGQKIGTITAQFDWTVWIARGVAVNVKEVTTIPYSKQTSSSVKTVTVLTRVSPPADR